ncbi:hypothetical protein VTG60DRAFT_833 [Thermothelomyces hinnuleus]
MAVCNITTDLMLVIFPVPVILSSAMTAKRKLQLVLLFSLSLAPVVVTIYRVPKILRHHGSQQTRSLYASIELLFATAAANALVLGSFVRDRGVKKRRFKYDSIAGASVDRSTASEYRRPTMLRHWGSDEDLVRDLGLGVKPELRETQPSLAENRLYVPAPPVHAHHDMTAWRFPAGRHDRPDSSPRRSDDHHADSKSTTRSDSIATHRRVSFFDYGGLLDDQNSSPTTNSGEESSSRDPSRKFGSASGSGSTSGSGSGSDSSLTRVPEPAVPASGNGFLRGSAALLQDLGGFWGPTTGSRSARTPKQGTKGGGNSSRPSPTEQAPTEGSRSPQQRDGPPSWEQQPQLMDVGGLLDPPGGQQH